MGQNAKCGDSQFGLSINICVQKSLSDSAETSRCTTVVVVVQNISVVHALGVARTNDENGGRLQESSKTQLLIGIESCRISISHVEALKRYIEKNGFLLNNAKLTCVEEKKPQST